MFYHVIDYHLEARLSQISTFTAEEGMFAVRSTASALPINTEGRGKPAGKRFPIMHTYITIYIYIISVQASCPESNFWCQKWDSMAHPQSSSKSSVSISRGWSAITRWDWSLALRHAVLPKSVSYLEAHSGHPQASRFQRDQ